MEGGGLDGVGMGKRGPRMGRELVECLPMFFFTLFEMTVYDVHFFLSGRGGGYKVYGY